MLKKFDKESFYRRVGSLIKAHRIQASVSQEELSKHLDFESRISIANIESGKQKIQLHTIVKLANFLKTPLAELIPNINLEEKTVNPKLLKKIEKEVIDDPKSAEKITAFIRYSNTLK